MNYRPILVLPTISKILEQCVYNLGSHNMLSSQQYSFCKKRSMEIATVLFLDEIHKAMDCGNLTGALFINLSKAFDTVSYSSILDKLPAYGISGNEKAWFAVYLFHRKMRVNCKETLSTPILWWYNVEVV